MNSEIDTRILEAQADFFQMLSQFEEVYKRYHDFMITMPIVSSNQYELTKIKDGLNTLSDAFSNIVKSYEMLCALKSVEV